jgi:hypothetical protein
MPIIHSLPCYSIISAHRTAQREWGDAIHNYADDKDRRRAKSVIRRAHRRACQLARETERRTNSGEACWTCRKTRGDRCEYTAHVVRIVGQGNRVRAPGIDTLWTKSERGQDIHQYWPLDHIVRWEMLKRAPSTPTQTKRAVKR